MILVLHKLFLYGKLVKHFSANTYLQTIYISSEQLSKQKMSRHKQSDLGETCGILSETPHLIYMFLNLHNGIDPNLGSGHKRLGKDTIPCPSYSDIWSIMSQAEGGQCQVAPSSLFESRKFFWELTKVD